MKTKYQVPTELKTLVHQQVAKFTFRSSVLRNLIDYQMMSNKGRLKALNVCRHYTNASGICPYEELYKPIQSALDRHLTQKYGAIDGKRRLKYNNYLHNLYKNQINNKIYAYTLTRIYNQLNSN